ncbi:hypothetical protein P7K49_011915 [Saguinus oedipus]|uniref:Thymidine kinase, cytosolic n=1 Tax=Saguinus oedipus TaxID=9490 RepID=A0ABQ9VS05_SAGOE|nr:hypothetical protein P7K49_011915 [Saguinus oedipus]
MSCINLPTVLPGSPSKTRGQIQVRRLGLWGAGDEGIGVTSCARASAQGGPPSDLTFSPRDQRSLPPLPPRVLLLPGIRSKRKPPPSSVQVKPLLPQGRRSLLELVTADHSRSQLITADHSRSQLITADHSLALFPVKSSGKGTTPCAHCRPGLSVHPSSMWLFPYKAKETPWLSAQRSLKPGSLCSLEVIEPFPDRTELMRRVRRFQIAQYKCLVIKYAKDTRYSSSFCTHDRNTMEALPACLLRDVAQEALGVAVIGIDEGQFLYNWYALSLLGKKRSHYHFRGALLGTPMPLHPRRCCCRRVVERLQARRESLSLSSHHAILRKALGQKLLCFFVCRSVTSGFAWIPLEFFQLSPSPCLAKPSCLNNLKPQYLAEESLRGSWRETCAQGQEHPRFSQPKGQGKRLGSRGYACRLLGVHAWTVPSLSLMEELELLRAEWWELSDLAASPLGLQGAAARFPDIVEFCEAMANAGKTVIVAALDGTFQRKAFGTILNLVPLAESVVKLTAVCMECFREAAYTKRLGTEKEVEVIGGADKYHSVCRLCYFKKASGQPAGLDNKENCPVPGKPGEAAAARKLFAPQQILQCSSTN